MPEKWCARLQGAEDENLAHKNKKWNNKFGQQGVKELPGYCGNELCLYVNVNIDLTLIVRV